jgi:hypothetical protein
MFRMNPDKVRRVLKLFVGRDSLDVCSCRLWRCLQLQAMAAVRYCLYVTFACYRHTVLDSCGNRTMSMA